LTRLSNQRITARRFCKRFTSAQRVSRSTRDTPRTLNSVFLQEESYFRITEVYFYSEVVSVYPCRVPLKVVSSSTRPVFYGAHPTPASASGRHKPRTLCNETWQHVPENTQKLRVLKRGAKRVNICVSVRKKKHPLRVRVMQTGCPPGEPSTRETFLCQCNTSRQA
jgi:hypothetical protein